MHGTTDHIVNKTIVVFVQRLQTFLSHFNVFYFNFNVLHMVTWSIIAPATGCYGYLERVARQRLIHSRQRICADETENGRKEKSLILVVGARLRWAGWSERWPCEARDGSRVVKPGTCLSLDAASRMALRRQGTWPPNVDRWATEYEGRPTNKLQNGIVLLTFIMCKIPDTIYVLTPFCNSRFVTFCNCDPRICVPYIWITIVGKHN